jgi:hypothetical protein
MRKLAGENGAPHGEDGTETDAGRPVIPVWKDGKLAVVKVRLRRE